MAEHKPPSGSLMDGNIIKQYESKEQVHKTVCSETSMFHDLTYNLQFIGKIKTNSNFSAYLNLFTV